MLDDHRLPTALEVAALLRRTEAEGGFATILRKGDADRGTILMLVRGRDGHVACIERMLDVAGAYRWQRTGPGESASSVEIAHFLEKRTRFDADGWAIELDVAEPERFIAETITMG
jgi:hypothetical protein